MKNEWIARLNNRIARTSTRVLMNGFLMLGMACIAADALMFRKYTGTLIENIVIPLCFFSAGLAGLPMILRKEADFSMFQIEGPLAVILGVVVLAAGLVVASIPLIGLLRH
jgi:hypothetical protein